MRVPHRFAALLALLATLPSLGQATQPWRPELEKPLHDKLAQPVDFELQNVSPFDALRKLAEVGDFELELWEHRLRRRGLEDDLTINVAAEGRPAVMVMESVLHEINDRLPIFAAAYEVYDGKVVIADVEYLEEYCSPVVFYDLSFLDVPTNSGPIKIDEEWVEDARRHLARKITPRTAEPIQRRGFFANDDEVDADKYAGIVQLITSSVGSPMDWRGRHVFVRTTENSKIMVRARPSWHQSIAWILEGLEREHDKKRTMVEQLEELLVISHLIRAEEARQNHDWQTAKQEVEQAQYISRKYPLVDAYDRVITKVIADRGEADADD